MIGTNEECRPTPTLVAIDNLTPLRIGKSPMAYTPVSQQMNDISEKTYYEFLTLLKAGKKNNYESATKFFEASKKELDTPQARVFIAKTLVEDTSTSRLPHFIEKCLNVNFYTPLCQDMPNQPSVSVLQLMLNNKKLLSLDKRLEDATLGEAPIPDLAAVLHIIIRSKNVEHYRKFKTKIPPIKFQQIVEVTHEGKNALDIAFETGFEMVMEELLQDGRYVTPALLNQMIDKGDKNNYIKAVLAAMKCDHKFLLAAILKNAKQKYEAFFFPTKEFLYEVILLFEKEDFDVEGKKLLHMFAAKGDEDGILRIIEVAKLKGVSIQDLIETKVDGSNGLDIAALHRRTQATKILLAALPRLNEQVIDNAMQKAEDGRGCGFIPNAASGVLLQQQTILKALPSVLRPADDHKEGEAGRNVHKDHPQIKQQNHQQAQQLVLSEELFKKRTVELQAANEVVQKKSDEVGVLKGRLSELKKELTRKDKELEEVNAFNQRLIGDKTYLEHENKKLQDNLRDMNSSILLLQEQNTINTKQLAQVVDDKVKLQEKNHELGEKNDELMKKQKQLEEKNDELNNRMGSLEQQFKKAMEAIQSQSKQTSGFQLHTLNPRLADQGDIGRGKGIPGSSRPAQSIANPPLNLSAKKNVVPSARPLNVSSTVKPGGNKPSSAVNKTFSPKSNKPLTAAKIDKK